MCRVKRTTNAENDGKRHSFGHVYHQFQTWENSNANNSIASEFKITLKLTLFFLVFLVGCHRCCHTVVIAAAATIPAQQKVYIIWKMNVSFRVSFFYFYFLSV